ncbi:MAG: LacI family transcriptional regulator [Firmicutes bacterium]|nr:LacI family transcriptional regulator [Bacillota bacterium]
MQKAGFRVTIKAVAQKAGVSTSAAARVLGNYGYTSKEMREKVLEAARELNYVPYAVARSLITLETQTIGLIIPDICNTFFAAVARNVENVAKKYGYRVLMCDTDGELGLEEEYLQDLFERRVDGIILASSASWGARHELVAKSPIPVVLIDRSIKGANLDCVRTNHEGGAYLATKHLIALGHRHIGIVLGTGEESVHRERFCGYRRALEEAGIPVDEGLVKRRDWSRGLDAVEDLLEQRPRPTAIFTTNNVVTVGVLSDLKRLNLRVPEDMAIVAFDDLDVGFLLESPLTAIEQNPSLIGRTAMELLIQRLSGDDAYLPPQKVILQPTLTVRASCGSQLASAGGNSGKEAAYGYH